MKGRELSETGIAKAADASVPYVHSEISGCTSGGKHSQSCRLLLFQLWVLFVCVFFGLGGLKTLSDLLLMLKTRLMTRQSNKNLPLFFSSSRLLFCLS